MAHVRLQKTPWRLKKQWWLSASDAFQNTETGVAVKLWLPRYWEIQCVDSALNSPFQRQISGYVLFRQLSVYIRYDLSRPINLLPLDREVRRFSHLLLLCLFDLRFCFIKFFLTGGQHTISTFHTGSTGGNAPWPWGRPNGELMWTDNRGSDHLVGHYR